MAQAQWVAVPPTPWIATASSPGARRTDEPPASPDEPDLDFVTEIRGRPGEGNPGRPRQRSYADAGSGPGTGGHGTSASSGSSASSS